MRGACPGGAPTARLPHTGQEEGAREASLCPALWMKHFIYMASLQASAPLGGARPWAEAERSSQAAAGPEQSGSGQEQRRHEALGARSQGEGRRPRRRQHRVSSRASGRDLHRHSSAHRMVGPLRGESKVCMGLVVPPPPPNPKPLTHHRDSPMSCTLGAGSRYW